VAFHEDLRNHRLKKGLILEEIAEDTKINVRILQALEQGDYHILPVPYIRLFMKAYAQAIEYPVEDILRGLENELKLTGDHGISTDLTEFSSPADMTGSSVTTHPDLFQREKSTQNNLMRLIGGIVILLLVIVLGKILLKSGAADSQSLQHAPLPGMNQSQKLESQDFPDSLLSGNSDTLMVSAVDFLSIILTRGTSTSDTIYQEPGGVLPILFNDSTRVALFPGDGALISRGQDTLPGSPFSNSWLVISADSSGGHLRTYPTL